MENFYHMNLHRNLHRKAGTAFSKNPELFRNKRDVTRNVAFSTQIVVRVLVPRPQLFPVPQAEI